MDVNEQFLIEWQCEQLLRRAAQFLDRTDWDAYVECFCQDAVMARPSDPDNLSVGREAILESLLARPSRLTCHLLANTVYEIVSGVQVIARSRVLLVSGDNLSERPAVAHADLLVGSFTDRLRKVDDQWKIADRRGSIELKYRSGRV